MKKSAQTTAVRKAIDALEAYDKQGESYANAEGRHGWRNPIRQDTGPLLEALMLAAAPKRVLEIGAAHGLSALYLLMGLEDWSGCEIDTIEFHEETAQSTAERMQALEVPVNVICGEAGEVIRGTLRGHYDVVFFDAQKSHYHGQLQDLLERDLIGPGTLLLADNVIDRSEECAAFLDWFVAHDILHRIVPTECGLLVCRLPDEIPGR